MGSERYEDGLGVVRSFEFKSKGKNRGDRSHQWGIASQRTAQCRPCSSVHYSDLRPNLGIGYRRNQAAIKSLAIGFAVKPPHLAPRIANQYSRWSRGDQGGDGLQFFFLMTFGLPIRCPRRLDSQNGGW